MVFDITSPLAQYGSLGLFVIYLIYDRQVILKKFMESIDKNTSATQELSIAMQQQRKNA